jgi:predicted DNA-binding protein YlxM (UPF0122 family)
MKLSQADKETMTAELQADTATMAELAERYNVTKSTISQLFKNMTGSSFQRTLQENQVKKQRMVDQAVAESPYRAWHKAEKTFYPVLGVDWFHRKVLILQSAVPQWLDVEQVMLMPWSGLRDQKRTQQYPEGQKIQRCLMMPMIGCLTISAMLLMLILLRTNKEICTTTSRLKRVPSIPMLCGEMMTQTPSLKPTKS